MNEAIGRDIAALNERFLLLVREGMGISPEATMLAFGLRASLAERIAALSYAEIAQLASSDMSLLRLRNDPHWWQSALDAVEQGDVLAVELLRAQTVFKLPHERGTGSQWPTN